MGLLDNAFDMLGNNPQQMMDSKNRLLQATLSLLANNGQNGGLHGLVERFQEAGLGNVISSWIGSGENVPITPEQVQEALGGGHLQQISEEIDILQEDRFIEAEFFMNCGDRRGCRLGTQQDARGIAGNEMDQHEADEADAEQHRDQLQRPGQDEPKPIHGGRLSA